MVITVAQTTAFFEANDQLGIPHSMVFQLQTGENIMVVSDSADLDKDMLEQAADNPHHPGGRAPDPDPGAAEGVTIPTPAFTFGAKLQKHIAVSAELVCCHDTVGRTLTMANMQWNMAGCDFGIQWKAQTDRKEEELETPEISKQLSIVQMDGGIQ